MICRSNVAFVKCKSWLTVRYFVDSENSTSGGVPWHVGACWASIFAIKYCPRPKKLAVHDL